MRIHKSKLFRRSGFTLVEMLVAAAVSIMLMVILTQAFAAGLDMFRRMRAQGNMQERLRMASITMRDDLTRPHFGTGGANLTSDGLSAKDIHQAYSGGWNPETYGYFRISQGQMSDFTGTPIMEFGAGGLPLPFALEGTDPEGLIYTRASTHFIAFTVRRNGETYNEMFRCRDFVRAVPDAPPGPYVFPRDFVFPSDYREDISGTESYFTSRWAEVAYFLAPTNSTTGGGVPLFTLHRRAKLLVPNSGSGVPSTSFIPASAPPASPEISSRTQISAPAGQFYNRPSTVSQPRNRFGMQPAPNTVAAPPIPPGHDPRVAGLLLPGYVNRFPTLAEELGANSADAGNDILLHDVLSFEIKAWWEEPAVSADLTAAEVTSLRPRQFYNYPGTASIPNTDYPFDYLPYSTKNVYFSNSATYNTSLARVFDTWSDSNGSPYETLLGGPMPEWRRVDAVAPNNTAARLPIPIRIKALQIRIRIWDAKTEQTRQITIIQDM